METDRVLSLHNLIKQLHFNCRFFFFSFFFYFWGYYDDNAFCNIDQKELHYFLGYTVYIITHLHVDPPKPTVRRIPRIQRV